MSDGRGVVVEIGRNDPCPCGSGKKYKRCCQVGPVDLMEEAARRIRGIQHEVEPKLVRFVRSLYGARSLDEAWEEFACGRDDLEPDGPDIQLFYPWMIYDWIPTLPGRAGRANDLSVAQLYLDTHAAQLPLEDAKFLQKTCAAPISFHDVIEVEPGRRIRVRDVLLQTERDVFERSGSETLRVGDVIFARVVSYDGVALMIGMGSISLSPMDKQPILRLREHLRKRSGEIRPEMLIAGARELRALYLSLRDRVMNPAPLVLNNTDGDPLEFHTIICEVASADAAFQALKSLAKGETEKDLLHDAIFDEDGRLRKVAFGWTKAGNRVHTSWENTVLGTVKIEGTTLTVDVNSARRAQKIQAEIRKRLGGTARKLNVSIKPLDEAFQDYDEVRDTPAEKERQAADAALRASPEVQEMLKQVLERHWEGWPTEKIPALNGKTPLQAIRSPEGREMVEALLLQFERCGPEPAGHAYDFNRLRRKLGLTTHERGPEPTA